MTFYWWSHWFWITMLSTLLLFTTFVQTYPSQEISLEYNQHSKPIKTVTKLYQTATTITWPTTTAPAPAASSAAPTKANNNQHSNNENIKDNDATDEKAILQDDTRRAEAEADDETAELQLPSTGVDVVESKPKNSIALSEDVDAPDDDSNAAREEEDENAESGEENGEHKRSAEANSKSALATAEAGKADAAATSAEAREDAADDAADDDSETDASVVAPRVAAVVAASAPVDGAHLNVKLKRDSAAEMNNYTNYSKAQLAENSTLAHAAAMQTQTADSNSAAAPAAPRINNAHAPTATTLAWLNAMAAAVTAAANALPTTVTPSSGIDRETVTVAQQQQQQRIPFTLENANKEEELRRAENEHRSRKSKVLSAEYKHINRYINYSSDTKSLLTRSASTAPNDFDGVEESNISSEALAIQRTYFLDAGAISAICFTIFGICCTVGTIGIVLYRRRYLNKPQALSEPDSSVYIDDSTMRDNSDEMYSLDNDSFLNSLEAMTIQNYWTDTVKHTKL